MNQEQIEGANFLTEPEISIWIDNYDDVFSDFDSRAFSERALSDDFLREVEKMVASKSNAEVRLKFHLLDGERNPDSEAIIINNLNHHFHSIAQTLKDEQKEILHRGYKMLGFGSLLILGLFYLTTLETKGHYLEGIILMCEPIGWFMTWTGLDLVFQLSRKGKTAIDFNAKMAKAKFAFSSFDAVQEASQEAAKKSVIPLDNNNLRVA